MDALPLALVLLFYIGIWAVAALIAYFRNNKTNSRHDESTQQSTVGRTDAEYIKAKIQESIYGIEEPIESDMWNEWKTTNPIALKFNRWLESDPLRMRDEVEAKYDLTTEDGQLKALEDDPRFIYYLSNPTDSQKWLTLHANPEWIKYFRTMPTNEMKTYAIELSPKVFKLLYDKHWYNSNDRAQHENKWGMSFYQ